MVSSKLFLCGTARRVLCGLALVLTCFGCAAPVRERTAFAALGTSAVLTPTAPAALSLTATLARLPLAFEALTAAATPSATAATFGARGLGYQLELSAAYVTLQVATQNLTAPAVMAQWHLRGARADAVGEALDALPGRSHYLLGNDAYAWRTDVAQYQRVRFRAVYPGIDVMYYGQQRQLEYDFIVAPHADARAIRLAFERADALQLNAQGDLLIRQGGQTLRQARPVAYQDTPQGRRTIAAQYALNGVREVGFCLGDYDARLPLVIDPVVTYASYLGGSGTDAAYAVAVDRAGSIYVAGQTFSPNFPLRSPLYDQIGGTNDVFVVKLNRAGTAVVFSTFLGGRGSLDRAWGLAVDGGGNVYLAGETNSLNFPTANAFQAVPRGNGDAFAAKLNNAGNALLYSTFLGGTLPDAAYGLALDRFDNAYISGRTDSTNFPTRNAFQANLRGQRDAFAVKLNADGGVVGATYFGGEDVRDDEIGYGIATDAVGNAYLAGVTTTPNLPVTANVFQRQFGGAEDGFIAKFDLDAGRLLFATYLGGDRAETIRDIAVDAMGYAYVTGYTISSDFPRRNAAQNTYGGSADAFIARLHPDGGALSYSTFLGGVGEENTGAVSDSIPVGAITVDALGNAYVTGKTESDNFPLQAPVQFARRGNNDALIAKLNPAGTAFLFSSYFGTSFTGDNGLDERGHDITLDTNGNIVLAGQVLGNDLALASPLQNRYNGGLSDGFLAQLNAADVAGVALVSAASFTGVAHAPESMIAAFGPRLAAGTEAATGFPLPTTLQGTTVTIKDVAQVERNAPLFFVSAGQINFFLPAGTAAGPATVTIKTAAGENFASVILVEPTAPALFSANANGQGVAAAVALRVKADGTQRYEPIAQFDDVAQRFVAVPLDLNNADEQVYLILFGSGLRQRARLESLSVKINGQPATVAYAGAQGNLLGLDQINLLLPHTLAGRGNVTIELSVDGQLANLVTLNVR